MVYTPTIETTLWGSPAGASALQIRRRRPGTWRRAAERLRRAEERRARRGARCGGPGAPAAAAAAPDPTAQ